MASSLPTRQHAGGVNSGRVVKNKKQSKSAQPQKPQMSRQQKMAELDKSLIDWQQMKPRGKDVPYEPEKDKCTVMVSTSDSVEWFNNKDHGFRAIFSPESFNPTCRIKRARPHLNGVVDDLIISSEHMEIIEKSAEKTIKCNFLESGHVNETAIAGLLHDMTIPRPSDEVLAQLAQKYNSGLSVLSFGMVVNDKDPVQVFSPKPEGKVPRLQQDDELHDLVEKLRTRVRCTILRGINMNARYAQDKYWLEKMDAVLKKGIFPDHEPFKMTPIEDGDQMSNLQLYFSGGKDLPICDWMRKDNPEDDGDDYELKYGKFGNRYWYTSLDEWCAMTSLACIAEVDFQQNLLEKIFNNKRSHKADVVQDARDEKNWLFKVHINCPDNYSDPKIPTGTKFRMWLAPEDVDMTSDVPSQEYPEDAWELQSVTTKQGRRSGLGLQWVQKKTAPVPFKDGEKKVHLIAEFNKEPLKRSFDAIQRIRKLDRCWLTEHILGRGYDDLPRKNRIADLVRRKSLAELKLISEALDVEPLNQLQREAVDMPLFSNMGMSFLQGPPGTGKSEVISGVANIANLLDAPCVVCAPSQAATFAVAKKIAGRIKKIEDKCGPVFREKLRMTLMPTKKRSQEMAKEFLYQSPPTPENDNRECHDVREYQWFHKAIEAGVKNYEAGKPGLDDWYQNYRKMTERKEVLSAKAWSEFWRKLSSFHEVLHESTMVISTCNTLELLREGSPDFIDRLQRSGIVIIDEAGFAQEWSDAIPLSFNASITFLVGDHKQLQPVIQSSDWNLFVGAQKQISIFERCCENMNVEFTRLPVTYRLPKELAKMVGVLARYGPLMYERRSDAEAEYAQFRDWFQNSRYNIFRRPRANGTFGPQNRRYFLNVRGRSGRPEGSLSTVNYANLNAILEFITDFNKAKPDYSGKIVIQVPFSAQLSELEEQLDIRDINNVTLFVGTINSFQGDEGDIVITCLTPANEHDGSEIGFLGTWNRMNVAISRPRHVLILVGNMDLWRTRMRLLSARYPDFANYCLDIIEMGDIYDIPCEEWMHTLPVDKEELGNKLTWSMTSPVSPKVQAPQWTSKAGAVTLDIRDAYTDGRVAPERDVTTEWERKLIKDLVDRKNNDELDRRELAKNIQARENPHIVNKINGLITQYDYWGIDSTEGLTEAEAKLFFGMKYKPIGFGVDRRLQELPH